MNSTKQWKILNAFKIYSSNFKIEDIRKILLENRGLKTKEEIDVFLNPKLEDVTVEYVGINTKQLSKAIKRIYNAIEKKEKIVVYGDYDVDGITGTAIVWEVLYGLGADVTPYIPHRIDEGYGLSEKGISNIQSQISNIKLIITVDNGIVANEAVEFANKQGIDVIITDHHTVSESVPNAFAIVHTTAVCGAAVGWMLTKAISNDKILNTKYQIPADHLSLVALATVADLVPLIGANRTLLTYGLKFLKQTNRPGLLALFEEAKIDPENIDVYSIGHMIAPRLNAMGRLESAMDSLRILCTKDRLRAKVLADTLGRINQQRQLLTFSTVEHAISQVKNQKSKVKSKLLFISHETYEEGIIGLVAGKLVETFYVPAIVLSRGEKVSKASARSIVGFNIIEAIRKASSLLINAGGHPMAAGFTVETARLDELQKALEEIVDATMDNGILTRTLKIDCELPIDVINQSMFENLQQLSPFGMGNPEPIFASEVVIAEIKQIGADGKHLKMKVSPSSSLRTNSKIGEAIAFGMGDLFGTLKKGDKVKIAYSISENTWNGKTNLQLKIKDIH